MMRVLLLAAMVGLLSWGCGNKSAKQDKLESELAGAKEKSSKFKKEEPAAKKIIPKDPVSLEKAGVMVEHSSFTVDGPRDKESMLKVMESGLTKLAGCYAGTLGQDNTFQGDMQLAFTVVPKGFISTSTIVGSSLPNTSPKASMYACCHKTTQSWNFGESKDEKPSNIRVTLLMGAYAGKEGATTSAPPTQAAPDALVPAALKHAVKK